MGFFLSNDSLAYEKIMLHSLMKRSCLNLGGDLCPIVFEPVLFVQILK